MENRSSAAQAGWPRTPLSASHWPSVKTAIDRTYPIARPLLMYSRGEPTGATKAYLDWILSETGQCIIMCQQLQFCIGLL